LQILYTDLFEAVVPKRTQLSKSSAGYLTN